MLPMTATTRLVLTTLAALAVAGGGMVIGQATDDDAPAPVG
jgi:hypothetical protein